MDFEIRCSSRNGSEASSFGIAIALTKILCWRYSIENSTHEHPCSFLSWMSYKLGGWGDFHDLTFVHEYSPIGNVLGKHHLMCHDHHGHACFRKNRHRVQDLF